MMDNNTLLYGESRTRVAVDHALIGPDSHVVAPLSGWTNADGVVLISPAMGAAPRAPRFCQYLVYADVHTRTPGACSGVQRLIYVLEGSLDLDGDGLSVDDFAWLPPDAAYELCASEPATLLVLEKPYVPLPGRTVPSPIIGNLNGAPAEPFHGDDQAMLTTLLPEQPEFDMAVNVFTYQSGAMLPFVETHVMEHGLYMRSGQGVYRLGECWYSVQKGDAIWMAAYCPQWFVAMGKQPASYIYYKDVNRDPLVP